jgi:addiction module RelB/DinJ family antitoxin
MCSISAVSQTKTVLLRTRISPERKEKAEEILDRLGLTPTQVINMLFAQIVERKGVPFNIGLPDNADVAVPIEHVAKIWNSLDDTDYSYLKDGSTIR